MTDIGFWLVIAFVFLAPWLVRAVRAPSSLAWPVFVLAIVLLALHFLGYAHVYVPSAVGAPLTLVLALAILARLATELFPRDRASQP